MQKTMFLVLIRIDSSLDCVYWVPTEYISVLKKNYRKLRIYHKNGHLSVATLNKIDTWAAAPESVPSDMCVQRRLKSACASAQSDQSLRSPQEETVQLWLSTVRPVKILISLRAQADQNLRCAHMEGTCPALRLIWTQYVLICTQLLCEVQTCEWPGSKGDSIHIQEGIPDKIILLPSEKGSAVKGKGNLNAPTPLS